MKAVIALFLLFAVAQAFDSEGLLGSDEFYITPLSKSMVHFINEKLNTTWKAGPSKFDSWSMASVKKLMGVPLSHMGHVTDNLPVIEHEIDTELPEEFDCKTNWPKCPTLREIRDQGNCGSCWAISAVEAMSDRICISSDAAKNVHLSTEDMVSCCKICGFGCNGGYPQMAWEHFKHQGVCTGGVYESNQGCKPYSVEACEHHSNNTERPPCQGETETPKCTHACNNNDYTVDYKHDKSYGNKVYTVKAMEDQIKKEMMTSGPVQTAFTVYADFPSYKSGVYQHKTGDALGGHAVKMMGWGVEDGTPYWLVANSWNTDWGNEGYFRILRGSDHCGIESSVVAGLPK